MRNSKCEMRNSKTAVRAARVPWRVLQLGTPYWRERDRPGWQSGFRNPQFGTGYARRARKRKRAGAARLEERDGDPGGRPEPAIRNPQSVTTARLLIAPNQRMLTPISSSIDRL